MINYVEFLSSILWSIVSNSFSKSFRLKVLSSRKGEHESTMHVKDLRKGVKLCVHHKICLENAKFNTFCQKKEVLLLFELEKVLPVLSYYRRRFQSFFARKNVDISRKTVHSSYPLPKPNIPANINLFKFSNRNTRKRYEIWSKLTIKTPEWYHWHHWRRSGVFIVNFEHISHFFKFLLLTLNKYMFAGIRLVYVF